MNKVEKVSLSGIAFTLEEPAYERLDNYIGRLQEYYSGRDGGDEIMKDIEQRISEILSSRIGEGEVVKLPLVEEVIAVLGDVDTITGEGETEQEPTPRKRTVRKRLYRSGESRVLGGVLGGMAAYFDIDPVILRVPYALLALILFFSSHEEWVMFPMIVLYLVLWIVVPKAKSVEQKYELYGERGDLKDIERSGGTYFERRTKSESSPLLKNIFHVIGVIIGVMLLFISVTGLFSVLAVIAGFEFAEGYLSLGLLDLFETGGVPVLVYKIAFMLVAVLPLLWFLYLSMGLLFRIRKRWVTPVLLSAWIASLVVCGVSMAVTSSEYAGDYHSRSVDTRTVEAAVPDSLLTATDTLHILYSPYREWDCRKMYEAGYRSAELVCCNGNTRSKDSEVALYPEIRVYEDSGAEKVNISYFKKRSGYSKTDMDANCYEDEIFIKSENGKLVLVPEIYSREHKYRFGKDLVNITVPEGMVVVLDGPGRVSHEFFQSGSYKRSDAGNILLNVFTE